MNATELGNKPAFPSRGSMGEIVSTGITYRQWLAGKALQGILANPHYAAERDVSGTPADAAIYHADELIARESHGITEGYTEASDERG